MISSSQSGFKPRDSCISQLLYESFDSVIEVRNVFLDMSKAFNKVWQKGLIHKLKRNGVAVNLLNTLANFLKDRKQRVVLNCQNSMWDNVEAGIPQGSVLGPLLFLIYSNDLSENLVSDPKVFADDTSPFSVIFDNDLSAKNLNEDLNRINSRAFQWKISFNSDLSKQAQEVPFFSQNSKIISTFIDF